MKKHYLGLSLIFSITMLLLSCGEGGQKAALSPVTGAANEIMVITQTENWSGPIGDTLKQFFGQEQVGVPQP